MGTAGFKETAQPRSNVMRSSCNGFDLVPLFTFLPSLPSPKLLLYTTATFFQLTKFRNGQNMNYEHRLTTAATLVLDSDVHAVGASVDAAEIGITAVLKPHQVEGLAWLIRRYHLGVNVILGDEMGLGKTLQAIALLSYLKVFKVSAGPFLVLCPLSVTDGWMSEMAKFAPKLEALRYVGDKEHRRGLRKTIYEYVKEHSKSSNASLLPFDVLLTTYDVALLDQDFLSQIPWHYTVVDEAQRLKNPSSVLYNVLKERFIMPRRLLMSGTPVQNNLTELWALMHFCMPLVFGTLEQFLSIFKEAGGTSGTDATNANEQFTALKCVLKAFMLRRTKSKLVECGTLVLPPLTEVTVMAPLVSLQKKVYLSILRKELSKLIALSSAASNHQSLQNIVIQLRKACSHPYLFPGIEPEPYEEGEHLVQASGKLIILDQLLQKLHDSGHCVLLFAQMTHTLDILQDYLELRKYSYERLDGSVRAEERFAAIKSFSGQLDRMNSESNQSGAFVFMISTRAGGVGLNLVAADTVIFYEQDWNPQVDKQALQRAHRIGQMNHVLSINLVTSRTVEQVIMRRAERKLQLSHNVVDDAVEQEGREMGVEIGDMRSMIFGLHTFDPSMINCETPDELNGSELNVLANKVMAIRSNHKLCEDGRQFDLDPSDQRDELHVISVEGSVLAGSDPGFDEASYLSWVEKLKEASQSNVSSILDLVDRRSLPEDRHLRLEAARKKTEEKKLLKWETLSYHSLSVKDPICPVGADGLSDSGSVHFVVGDCTLPTKVCPSEPTIIFSCVDASGNWGHGGMLNALAKLSSSIPEAYERASEVGDLHLGDLHLIQVNENNCAQNSEVDASQWVALAVVQSYNRKRKVPRGDISIPDLERCISKASFAAAQNSASIHMPRIGYQDGSDRSQWYTVERLLRKYASLYGIMIYVYYYRRSS